MCYSAQVVASLRKFVRQLPLQLDSKSDTEARSTRQGRRGAHRRRAMWSGQSPPSFDRRRWRAPRNGCSMEVSVMSHARNGSRHKLIEYTEYVRADEYAQS